MSTLRVNGNSGPSRRLPGVGSLRDGMKGHNYGLPDCLRLILGYMEYGAKLDFWDLAALTGDTIAPVYDRNPSTGREYCVSGFLAGPGHVAEALSFLGIGHVYADAALADRTKPDIRQRIMDSVDQGLPVLAVTNLRRIPGWNSDVGTYGLATGYKNGGQSVELRVEGTDPLECRVAGGAGIDWVFLRRPLAETTPDKLYLHSIGRMVHWLTLPARDGLYFGPAALRAWADDIAAGRYGDDALPLWDNYGVYVANIATSGGESTFLFAKLAAADPVYSRWAEMGRSVRRLLPAETPTGGKSLLWMRLEELGAGLDMAKTRATLRDPARRSAVADALRDYADRLDQVVRLLAAWPSLP